MSFSTKLVHDVTVVRTIRDEDDDDEYGQPTDTSTVETAVRGLVQARSMREILDSRSAGVEIGDHVIYLAPMDLHSADYLLYAGDRYQVVGVRRFDFGRTPHLEVDTRKIESSLVAAGS